MHIGVFLQSAGHHSAAWRLPEAAENAGLNLRHFVECANIAERGKLDFIFFADFCAVSDADVSARGFSNFAPHLDPTALLSALATSTERVGLIATMTSTYNAPYHVARKFASIDYMSEGRAGWNLVTSTFGEEAYNFGLEKPLDAATRYERAGEFADVVMGLWRSWEPDALIADKQGGLYYDPAKLHRLEHAGKHFTVRGPLTIPPSPQGRPVIVQAGASDDGINLAGRVAEVVFTAQNDLGSARAFYDKLKARAETCGRTRESVKILPGIAVVVGENESEAQAKLARLNGLIHPALGLARLSNMLGGVDLSGLSLDGPLPEIDIEKTTGQRSRIELVLRKAEHENASIRDLMVWAAGTKGHNLVVGTPTLIADRLEEWVYAGAADGFVLMPLSLPGDLKDFVTLVVPELRRRGCFRHEYAGVTLRQHLGL